MCELLIRRSLNYFHNHIYLLSRQRNSLIESAMFFWLCLISLTKTLEQSLCSKTLGISINILKFKIKNVLF